jgi:hypothetical protein
MPRPSLLRLLPLGALVAMMVLAPHADAAAPSQRIAVPSYFYPGSLWTQLNAASPTVGLAIINPNSGPGDAPNPDYVAQVIRAKAARITVIGYVHTSYGDRAASVVQAEIDKYYAWYGVDGIFLDEVSTDCARLSYYSAFHANIKARGGAARVVLNPGTQTSECYMSVADIVLTFENTYTVYTTRYSAPAWVQKYPAERFWHLVHDTATTTQMQRAVTLSKQRRVGWVYVTPDKLPNPWDTLPAKAYWNAELAAVR